MGERLNMEYVYIAVALVAVALVTWMLIAVRRHRLTRQRHAQMILAFVEGYEKEQAAKNQG